MTKTIRREHSDAFKARVAFEALKGEKTITEIASQFGVHLITQINKWKKQLKIGMRVLFTDKRKKPDEDQQQLIQQLHQQVGKKRN